MNLCDASSCCGCGACAEACPQKCITMQQNAEGFYHPLLSEDRCVKCGTCERCCPVFTTQQNVHEPFKTYAAWAKDSDIRTSSSSGGLYSVFGEYVLQNGGAINGVSFDSEMVLKHHITDKSGDTIKFRGSKYVQSNTNGIYSKVKDELKKGRQVLFTSVPCQVAALKAFLRKDYDNLTTCDLVCHGVPSQSFLRSYLENQCPIPLSEIESMLFRKLNGWGIKIKVLSRRKKLWTARGIKNGYLYNFLRGNNYNNACYHCKYASKKRIGDITLGDFWGIGKKEKFDYDPQKGCSVVLINTDKGFDFFNSVKNWIFYEERSYSEAIRENHQLIHPADRPLLRDKFTFENYQKFYHVPLSGQIVRYVRLISSLASIIRNRCRHFFCK